MPITSSAKKALRQNVTRRARNLKTRETYKKAVKDFRRLISAKRFDEAKKELSHVYQVLDKTAKSGIIKKNSASRLKSRLTQLIAKSSKASS